MAIPLGIKLDSYTIYLNIEDFKGTQSLTRLEKDGVGVSNSSRAKRDKSELDRSKIDNNEIDDSEVGDDKFEKNVQKLSKSKNLFKSKEIVRLNFFIFGARLAFTKLRQVFVKAPIFQHFDTKRHIQIETDASGYAIGGVFNQPI